MLKVIIAVMWVISITCFLIPSYTASYRRVEPQNRPINDIIAENATKYHVSEKTLHKIVSCESTYNEYAIGDGGNSFGLVQIHLPSHPNITKAEAYDKEFAVDFLAKNVAQGKAKMWSCARITGVI